MSDKENLKKMVIEYSLLQLKFDFVKRTGKRMVTLKDHRRMNELLDIITSSSISDEEIQEIISSSEEIIKEKERLAEIEATIIDGDE